jgi:hypothetical protein
MECWDIVKAPSRSGPLAEKNASRFHREALVMGKQQLRLGIRFQVEREAPTHFLPLGLVAGLFLFARGAAIGPYSPTKFVATVPADSIDDLLHYINPSQFR